MTKCISFFPSIKIFIFSYITKSNNENEESKLTALQKVNLIGTWVHNIFFEKKSGVLNMAAIPALQRLKQENRGVYGHSVLCSEFSDSQDYVRFSENKTIKERKKEIKVS